MTEDLDESRRKIDRTIEELDREHEGPTFFDLIKFLVKGAFVAFGVLIIVLWIGGGIFNIFHSSAPDASEMALTSVRDLCDRAEAGEAPAVVFEERQPARLIPKLRACLAIGSYPHIENVLIPSAVKIQDVLDDIRRKNQ